MPTPSLPSARGLARHLLVAALWLLLPLLSACMAQTPPEGDDDPRPPLAADPFGRGVNFGNALEAPEEGWWGLTLQQSYVEAIAQAGFETVRLPVKWSGHAGATAPYAIDPAFLARVDEVVGWILDAGLNVIVDFHHYDEMSEDPAAHVQHWLGIWRQIAEHYREAPDALAFELLNEPNQALGAELWNQMVVQALPLIRQSNPSRWLVVGPVSWNAIGALPGLRLPEDERLVLTVHYYDPFEFTHQGAEWVADPPPLGRSWDGVQLAPRAGWYDWSWDTSRAYGEQLTITFEAGWAGYYLQPAPPVGGYQRLALRASRAVDLLISCGEEGGGLPLRTAPGVELLVELEACGGGDGVSRLFLQNGSDQPQEPFVLELLELRGPAGTMPLLVSEAEAVAASMDLVLDWAEANGGLPVLLGEFGAYGTADMASRARWTRTVREAAEERGFGWAYWEFGAGFGVYDPEAEAWRPELLEALLLE